MNAPALPKVRMNVEEFLAWSKRQPDDRYELVDGEIVAMTRDTVRHNRTKAARYGRLKMRCGGPGCHAWSSLMASALRSTIKPCAYPTFWFSAEPSRTLMR